MNNIKCAECGLVNWATEVECKRCGSLLTVQDKKAQSLFVEMTEPKPFLTTGLKGLLIILGVVTLAAIVSRVFVITYDLTVMLAVVAIVVGTLLYIAAHIWLLVRIFEQSIGWGICTLLIPWAGLFAIVKFWQHTRRSFVAQLLCVGIVVMGFLMVPAELKPQPPPPQTKSFAVTSRTATSRDGEP